METKPEKWTANDLIHRRDERILHVNPEYQRGAVWSDSQRRMLIDSVLRGYHIPLFYFRLIKTGDEKYGSRTLEIVDGQQRINALYDFAESNLPPLYDASEEGRFPASFRAQACPWAGKQYRSLPDNIRNYFDERDFAVVIMDCDEDEARDLFIRLQGGSTLNPQEVRDAWPGNLCNLVLELGGKEPLDFPGHDFFRNLVRAPIKDRGQRRQAVAQLLMSFLERREKGPDGFVAAKNEEIDDFYRRHVGLRSESTDVRRFRTILDKLAVLFAGHHPFKMYESVDLILFVDSLWDKRGRKKWESAIVVSLDEFSAEVTRAKGIKEFDGTEDKDFRQIWRYSQITFGIGSNNVGTIRERHEIYVHQMTRLLDKHSAGNNL